MEGLDVLRWFAGSAALVPEAVAVEHGPRRLTYRELDGWSANLARDLRREPLGPHELIAVCLRDPLEMVVALLGVLRAGAVFVPLDLEQPAARLRRMLARLAPHRFIAAEASDLSPLLPGEAASPAWYRLDGAQLSPVDHAGEPPLPGLPGPGPDDPCTIFHTSGSSGEPKGITGRYQAIGHFIRWEAGLLGLERGVRVSQLTAPFFDAWLRDVFIPLSLGGTLCIPEGREIRLEAEALAGWIEEREIHLVHCVPSLFHLLVSAGLRPSRFPGLRHVLLAGEPPLRSDLAAWFEALGRRVSLINLYGPTETTMTKLFHPIEPADLERRAVPIGRPMEGAAALLVDRRDRLCPPGTIGEILIRTPYRSLGYFGQPELTAQSFVQNPFSDDPADLVYRTGDLGRLLPDGALDFLGRRDDQVKVRGQRVELHEVESALAGHPALREAAVVERQDAEGLTGLCAFAVAHTATSPSELRAWLADRVPAALLPDLIVLRAELPKTRNGKIDRQALREVDLRRREARPGAAQAADPALWSATQRQVLELWRELLAVQDLDLDDNFFEVGGHSLMATRLLIRVRSAFGVEVPLRDFLDEPTIAALSDQVEDLLLRGADSERLEEMLRELEAAPPA